MEMNNGAINENHGEKEGGRSNCFTVFIEMVFYFILCFLSLFLFLYLIHLHRTVSLDANADSYACGAVPELQLPYAASKAQ